MGKLANSRREKHKVNVELIKLFLCSIVIRAGSSQPLFSHLPLGKFQK